MVVELHWFEDIIQKASTCDPGVIQLLGHELHALLNVDVSSGLVVALAILWQCM